MPQSDSTSWIDRVVEDLPDAQKGDNIVGYIGSAQVAAIGKNISQQQILGKPQPNDAEEVAKAIKQLRDEFQKLLPQLSERERYVAEDKIDVIEGQLQKKDGPPSGDLIRDAGDWLVDNIPALGGALLSAFIPDPVGRILVTAGTATISWIKNLRDRVTS